MLDAVIATRQMYAQAVMFSVMRAVSWVVSSLLHCQIFFCGRSRYSHRANLHKLARVVPIDSHYDGLTAAEQN